MIKKPTLLKKLSSYSALATVLVAGAATQNADGQIIYHDIKPDTILSSTSLYYLDLDGDNTPDFQLLEFHSFTTSTSSRRVNLAGITAQSGNSVEQDTVKAFTSFIQPNNYNNVIGASDKWATSGGGFDYCTVGSFKNHGVFAGKGDKYVGLRLNKNGKNYYGWVRVYLSSKCDTLIVKDYAYNATPNDSIKAGQTTSGIEQLNTNAANLESSPNPATTISNINYELPAYSTVTIELYDVTGRKIETVLDNEMQPIGQHKIQVDVSKLNGGIYFYALTINGRTFKLEIAVAH